MHGTIFAIKRANQVSQNYLNRKLRPHALTAARFDMMVAIGIRSWGVPQKWLVHKLGVSKEVIWRMLKALRELGFVGRRRMGKRRWLLFITRLGRRAFSLAAKHVWPHVKRAVRALPRRYLDQTAIDYYIEVVEIMEVFQSQLGDHSRELYAYGHYDD